MTILSIHEADLNGKTVLLRADLNVPARRGKVTDTTRIDRLHETVSFLSKAGAKILIISHFGRPEGEQNPEMSLAFLVPVLQEQWGMNVSFATNCIGPEVEKLKNKLSPGDIGLLENVRFHKGEKKNDPDFAKALAAHADIFVNDAFSAAHRAHASTAGVAEILPAYAGLLMQSEIQALDQALGKPQRPVCAVTGGSKISTKLSVLHNLVKKTDKLVLGGAMANTFLYAKGAEIGDSMCEKEMKDEAQAILKAAEQHGCEIILPVDCVCTEELKPFASQKILSADTIEDGYRAIDIGPETIKKLDDVISGCKTLVWNGPMGVFEIKPFDNGTNALAELVARQTSKGALISIAGGGDTIAALENAGYTAQMSYISTAGGAFLEWLEGKSLPGVAALENAQPQGKASSG